jgi:hypothetical protein
MESAKRKEQISMNASQFAGIGTEYYKIKETQDEITVNTVQINGILLEVSYHIVIKLINWKESCQVMSG